VNERNKNKVGFGTKLGYSMGVVADTMGYSIFYSYFSVFLTTVVGVNAALAGVISALGILWDGITDPVVGYLADKKAHRRRKMIQWGSLFYAAAVVLTYVSVSFGETAQSAYYIICCLAFWLFYTVVCVPFYSAVPELTDDYDERTRIGSFRATMATFANLITMASPMLLVSFFGKWTGSAAGGWTMTAGLFGVIIVITATICAQTLKRAEKGGSEEEVPAVKLSFGEAIGDMLKTFASVLKLKQALILFVAIVVCNIYRGFTSNGFTYFFIYSVGWSGAQVSFGYAVLVASWFLYFPLINLVCKKWDRKVCLIGGALISGIVRLAVIPIVTTTVGAYISIFSSNFLTCSYLALIFSLPYDVGELYEYKNNGRRADSTIQSIPLMAQKMGAAVGALIWGIALDSTGFDGTAAVQAEGVSSGLVSIYMGWITLALLAYAFILGFYKMNKSRTKKIQEANAARKAGKEYSEEGFSDVL
jgi:GPH family glycoside/pentoside/hexuronide:cation symporter